MTRPDAYWRGDLRTASPAVLDDHRTHLVLALGSLAVKQTAPDAVPPWRTRALDELARAPGWASMAARLAAVCNETSRREECAGSPAGYRALRGTASWDRPWAG